MANANPIEHVVVLMLENRSFDHLFGFRQRVKGLKGDESNLLDPAQPQSGTNPAFIVSDQAPFVVTFRPGPGHNFPAVNVQLCGSVAGPEAGNAVKNNGFVKDYQFAMSRGGHDAPFDSLIQVMQSFGTGKLPSLEALADQFCLCDNWFCEVPGPTMPNRCYIHAATSAGFVHNRFAQPFTDVNTIYHNLEQNGQSWATYFVDLNEVFTQFFGSPTDRQANFRRFEQAFRADVQGDKLPNYSFILPRFNGTDSNDMHAPHDVRLGDNLVADVFEALRSNDQVWNRSALIITWDEHGGFYDHVQPPSGVPNPDNINSPAPNDPDPVSKKPPFDFTRLGLRVPTLIVSPWVDPQVNSKEFRHTSILATVKRIFGLPAFLTKRDQTANTFEDLFTGRSSPRTDTPTQLPRASLPAIPHAVVAGVPTPLDNQPLDSLQQEMLEGFLALSHKNVAAADASLAQPASFLPSTQAQAAALVDQRWKTLGY
jgi:phospholipase C